MEERRFWSIDNVLTTLKAIVASLLIVVAGIIPAGIAYALVRFTNLGVLSYIISGLWLIFSLWFWGYLVNRWWYWE